jgi:hypothetical protein
MMTMMIMILMIITLCCCEGSIAYTKAGGKFFHTTGDRSTLSKTYRTHVKKYDENSTKAECVRVCVDGRLYELGRWGWGVDVRGRKKGARRDGFLTHLIEQFFEVLPRR